MSFAVLRLRGKGDLRREVKDTLRLLHLTRQNHCAIVPQDPTYRGMLQLVKDYVTWGEVDPEDVPAGRQAPLAQPERQPASADRRNGWHANELGILDGRGDLDPGQ